MEEISLTKNQLHYLKYGEAFRAHKREKYHSDCEYRQQIRERMRRQYHEKKKEEQKYSHKRFKVIFKDICISFD